MKDRQLFNHLVCTALRFVDLPMQFLVVAGTVECDVTPCTPLVSRAPALGADELLPVCLPVHGLVGHHGLPLRHPQSLQHL